MLTETISKSTNFDLTIGQQTSDEVAVWVVQQSSPWQALHYKLRDQNQVLSADKLRFKKLLSTLLRASSSLQSSELNALRYVMELTIDEPIWSTSALKDFQ